MGFLTYTIVSHQGVIERFIFTKRWKQLLGLKSIGILKGPWTCIIWPEGAEGTDVFLYKSLWENYPLAPLYYDLSDCFTDGFMDSVTSFSLIEYSIIFIFKIMILTTKHKRGKRLFMSFIYSLWSCDRIISSSEQTCLWYVCLCAWMRTVASFSDFFLYNTQGSKYHLKPSITYNTYTFHFKIKASHEIKLLIWSLQSSCGQPRVSKLKYVCVCQCFFMKWTSVIWTLSFLGIILSIGAVAPGNISLQMFI